MTLHALYLVGPVSDYLYEILIRIHLMEALQDGVWIDPSQRSPIPGRSVEPVPFSPHEVSLSPSNE